VEALARQSGLEVHPLVLEPRQTRSNALRLGLLLERHPVALVNSQSSRDREALTRLALTGGLRVPFIATRRQMPRTFFLVNWLTSRVASRMVAVSRAVGEALVRRGTPRRKLVVIPNGLVTARIDVPVTEAAREGWRRRIGWEPSRPTIGIVAREKDQKVVLQALRHVQTPVRLVLAGVGPAADTARLARTVPSHHRVVCLPFDPDVRPLYDLLDLVLLPSRSEGLSQSLLEAMALSKPVIASASTGNLEVVTNGVDGRLVAPRDPRAWAKAIEDALSDMATATRMAEAARVTARVRFALSGTIQRTIDLYKTILGG
jgi:glycosyltransferase involved in cell wall biosynthesis